MPPCCLPCGCLCPQSCQSCVAANIHKLWQCSQANLHDFCEATVVASYDQLYTEFDEVSGYFKTEVPQCGSTKQNCWEQTRGAADIDFKKQLVTSSQFPCKSGSSYTTFVADSKISLAEAECKMEVKGFGGKTVSVGQCRTPSSDDLYLGFNCPTATGMIEAAGPEGRCDGGFGSYTITISCPAYDVVTYVRF